MVRKTTCKRGHSCFSFLTITLFIYHGISICEFGNNRSDISSSSNLEASLIEKERIIAELHAELHTLESQLSVEREQHISELKKLNALMNEKVISLSFTFFMTLRMRGNGLPGCCVNL